MKCVACEQYFADRDIFCAGRVAEEDLQRVAAATGGTVQTSVNNVIEEVLLCSQTSNHECLVLLDVNAPAAALCIRKCNSPIIYQALIIQSDSDILRADSKQGLKVF